MGRCLFAGWWVVQAGGWGLAAQVLGAQSCPIVCGGRGGRECGPTRCGRHRRFRCCSDSCTTHAAPAGKRAGHEQAGRRGARRASRRVHRKAVQACGQGSSTQIGGGLHSGAVGKRTQDAGRLSKGGAAQQAAGPKLHTTCGGAGWCWCAVMAGDVMATDAGWQRQGRGSRALGTEVFGQTGRRAGRHKRQETLVGALARMPAGGNAADA